MRRREFGKLVGGAAIMWPLAARAQQKTMPVIGWLSIFSGPYGLNSPFWAAFRQGLSETGYVVGQNVAVEYRWAEGHYDRLPALAADLVGSKVDVIGTSSGSAVALAAKNATSTIPIVFMVGTDPVADGLVASFARPGGNLTGISQFNMELMPKRVQLLSEMVPHAKAIALLVDANFSLSERMMLDVQAAARVTGVQQLHILKAGNESELDAAFATLVQLQVGAVLVSPSVFFGEQHEQLVALAAHHAVPAMYDNRLYVAAGGLVSYGTLTPANPRQLGIYVGKILNGAKPADLPVQQPTKFELVVNLKTAKALGLAVPQSILARADEVIE